MHRCAGSSCAFVSPPEALTVQSLFIELGSLWKNGYLESFNGKLRHELLDREISYPLTEAHRELWTTRRTALCQVTRVGSVANPRRG